MRKPKRETFDWEFISTVRAMRVRLDELEKMAHLNQVEIDPTRAQNFVNSLTSEVGYLNQLVGEAHAEDSSGFA
jgi:hypothetical protein